MAHIRYRRGASKKPAKVPSLIRFLSQMTPDQLIALILQYRYWIIAPISIPEWPILAIISGFLCAQNLLNFPVIFIIIVSGDLIGDTLWYWIARVGARKALHKYGHFLKLTEDGLEKFNASLNKHFWKTMILWKITNVAMLSIIIAAGIARIDYRKFIFSVFILAIPKTIILLLVGYYFGKSYAIISQYMDKASQVTILIFIFSLLFYFTYVFTKKLKVESVD